MAERGAPLKNTDRDREIVQRVLERHEKPIAVALDHGITSARVSQIVKRHLASLPAEQPK